MKIPWIFIAALATFMVSSINPIDAFQDQKNRARLYLTYFKLSPTDRFLDIKVTTRKDRRNVPVEGTKIEFYVTEKTNTGYLGSIITDTEGLGTLILSSKFYEVADSLNVFTFIASLTDDPNYLEAEKELEIIDAAIEVNTIDQDSLKWVQAIVRERDSTRALVISPDVDLSFLVERPLCLLPISDITSTDAKGAAMTPFPLDLPGDSEGYVTIVAKIDDSDSYGTVEQRETIRWGIPTSFDDRSQKRSLWAARANAPIILVLLVNALILATWGIILYIVNKLYQISKL
ncbi:MAG: hypothetical protein OEQ53_03780 [Saprospiraceae bacterium]|nr:hypothetical protein [Saprospiraceae bacterium]